MNKELYQDYINGLSISELSNKYKISKTRVYKEIAEYSKEQGKVLKIIKEKNVDLNEIRANATVKGYNSNIPYYRQSLTEEEFRLVKEWMK